MVLLEAWTDTILRPILADLSSGLGSMFGLSMATVLESPEAWGDNHDATAQVAGYVSTISTALMETAAAVVLVILFLLEMHRVMLMTDGDGDTKLRMSVFTWVKFGVVWAVFHQTPAILAAIYQFGTSVASETNKLFTSDVWPDRDFDEFLGAVKDLDWLGQTVLVVLMLLAWLINKGAVLGGFALVVMRFIKLYIYGAFAPVPMAMMVSDHTRSFGIGFIKNYAATVLQSFVLVILFGIYTVLTTRWAGAAMTGLPEGGVAAAVSLGGKFIFMGILLGMLVMGSGKIANELLGG